jgi:hypothetical protein
LGPLATGIGNLSDAVGDSLGTGLKSGAAASGGVMILYFAAGFIWGYLWCSLRVFREMQALVERERNIRGLEAPAA